jgi:uncharacterized membrane protein SpoIIM required for sporulation
MVLEALLSPIKAEKHPAIMILLGMLYASMAIVLSIWIFSKYSSLVMVFLTSLAAGPIVYSTIKLEERKDEEMFGESLLLREHSRALMAFMYLFIGFSIAFALWYLFIPVISGDGSTTNHQLFQSQIDTIKSINTRAAVIGMAAHTGRFMDILLNNLNVLIFCILFSLIYGLGAIFILAWNASVIGAAIGIYIEREVATIAGSVGFVKLSALIQIYAVGFLKYSLHGPMEILGYFIGGLAGGIVSVAVVRHTFGTKKFEIILIDAADLVMLSVGVLVLAAVVEVWITPIVF